MKKLLIIISVLIGAGVTAGGIWGYHFLKSGLPALNGFLEVDDVTAPVQIYRNMHGVPQIWAQNERDLYFATGYVMAQDRLFQMDLMRRAALGELSEIIGEPGLEQDEESRIIGFARDARKLATKLDKKTRMILQSFSQGINACMETMKTLPVEFRLIGYKPEPWQPWHSIAVARLVGWTLGMRAGLEVVSLYARARLGDKIAARLFPARLPSDAMRLADGDRDSPLRPLMPLPPMPGDLRKALAKAGPPKRLEAAIAAIGSNSWAVSGILAKHSRPILANDPHLALTQPSFWYLLHQHTPHDLNVVGGAIPGTPTILIGRNDHIAWGLTNVGADFQDFFLEKLSSTGPGVPSALDPDNTWHVVKEHDEQITIKTEKGTKKETLKVLSTKRGVLVSGLLPDSVKGYGLALSWPGREETNELLALYNVNKAADFNEFEKALEVFGVAPQNFLYADKSKIGFVEAGWIPKRVGFDGRGPAPAFLPGYKWNGRIPFSLLPKGIEPVTNVLAIANQQPVGDRYLFDITTSADPPIRAKRIQDILSNEKKVSSEFMQEMQVNAKSPAALKMAARFIAAAKTIASPSEAETRALELLESWDGTFSPESEAALVFSAVYDNALRAMFEDELGPLYNSYRAHVFLIMQVFEKELSDPDSVLVDDRRTKDKKETAREILKRAFRQGVSKLVKRTGGPDSDWSYSRFHVFERKHPLAAGGWILRKIFSRGPDPVPGSPWCIDATSAGLHPFRAIRAGPSMRIITDFADEPPCVHVAITGGESGHVLSPYYDDQTRLWLSGELMTLPMNLDDVRSSSSHRLVLSPKKGGLARNR
ncbi:MAG: penicillin acylase family protein [Deltaproteobacteria bacterium]|nr:penicillin acylase family protein [Deltaproteobacteria bacterium]